MSKFLPVADPDRCHGFQETYENCPHKFNTIYNFVLGKNNNQEHDTFFAEVVTLYRFMYKKQAVSRPAAGVTGYLPIEIY